MCVVGSRAGGVKPSSPFGAQMIVLQASDVRHRAVDLVFALPGFGLALVQSLLSMRYPSCLEQECLLGAILCRKYITCLFCRTHS